MVVVVAVVVKTVVVVVFISNVDAVVISTNFRPNSTRFNQLQQLGPLDQQCDGLESEIKSNLRFIMRWAGYSVAISLFDKSDRVTLRGEWID